MKRLAAEMEAPVTENIVKKEFVDRRLTDFILRRMTVDDFPEGNRPSPDDLAMLKASVKKWVKADGQVTYKRGVHGDGRLYAAGRIGLQGMKREIRALLAEKYCWDIDMVNAQPVILEQLCKQKGWLCPWLTRYVKEREEILLVAAEEMKCDRSTAKSFFVSMLFGCGRETVMGQLPSQTPFWDELSLIRNNIWEDKEYAALRKSVEKNKKEQKNPKTTLSALVLQNIECKCLLIIEAALLKKDRTMSTFIHDGGHVNKLKDEKFFPEDHLRFCEAEVEAAEGYQIKLAVKPLESRIVVRDYEPPALENGYDAVKKRFEEVEGISLIIEKALFSQKTADGTQLVTRDALHVSYGDWTFQKPKLNKNGEWETVSDPFLKAWQFDESKRKWRNVGFWPSHDARPGILNTFDGFKYEHLLAQEIPEADKESMALLDELCENVTGGHGKLFLDLIAYIVQNPTKRTGVCVVLKGESGVGKDTLLQFIGQLFGKKMYANLKDAARDVFGTFNGMMKEAFFVHLEEANSAVFSDPKISEMFKALITSGNLPINQKHREQVDGHTYANFFMSTNRDIAVRIEADDRRFWLLESRAEHKGETCYWQRMHDTLQMPSVQRTFVRRMLARNITGFNPCASRPHTLLHDITRRRNIEPSISFLNDVAFESGIDSPYDENGIPVVARDDFFTRFCTWAEKQQLRYLQKEADFINGLKLRGAIGVDAPLTHCKKRCGRANPVSAFVVHQERLKLWLREKRLVVDSANDEEPLLAHAVVDL